MRGALQIVTVIAVSVGMARWLAYALEFPSKKRLTQDAYCSVQPISYPGFTIGGLIGEFGGFVLLIVLLLLTPDGGTIFRLTLSALTGLVGIQAVYRIFTHPVNTFRLKGQPLSSLGSGFFSFGTSTSRRMDWTELRDRWEYSHVARAVLSIVSFVALATAVTL